MAQPTPVLGGWLVTDRRRTPVQLRFASRHSLWAEIDRSGLDGESVRLELTVADGVVRLGPCTVLPEAGGRRCRLVPRGVVHDFEKLFFHGRVETLESSALNLPLILSYKDRIDPAFRDFVADLTYDVNVYKNLIDRLDSESEDEPTAVQDVVHQGVISSIGEGLASYLESRYAELGRIVAGYSEKEHEHHGFYFRKQLWNIILCAPFIARTNLKPRGYSGDSEMMRMIYENGHRGSSTFGKILHNYAVRQPAGAAVRNRRRDVAALIHAFVKRGTFPAAAKLRILSVACGPALEISDILRTKDDCERLHFSLLDQDEQALLEAAGLVGDIESRLACRVSADFIKESVRTMLVTRQLQSRWGHFHFIYSMGLFDYLTPPVAAAVLRKLYTLLEVGGELIVGNLLEGNPSRFFMEYWLDWKIILRSREELLRLAAGLPGAKAELAFDETGIQMLLRVEKQDADA